MPLLAPPHNLGIPRATVTAKTVDWQNIRETLEHINVMAVEDLRSAWNTARRLPDIQARDYMFRALEIIMETYGAVASDVSADWWNDMMVDPNLLMEPAPLFYDFNTRTGKVTWATKSILDAKADPFARMALTLQQAIFMQQRVTVYQGAVRAKVGYARYAQADACAFCRVLASRGAVYGSKAAALYVGATGVKDYWSHGKHKGARLQRGRIRGVQKAGETYHDHCRCVTAPAMGHLDMNYPDYMDKFLDEYGEARNQIEESGYMDTIDMKKITAQMRLMGFGA